jgi:hypothetical protein
VSGMAGSADAAVCAASGAEPSADAPIAVMAASFARASARFTTRGRGP